MKIISKISPYIALSRLNRPVGIWLLLFPCLWALFILNPGWPSLKFLIIFTVGAAVMRSAGCVYNDIIDRSIDKQVDRTQGRPLPAGLLTPLNASIFLGILLIFGLFILLLLPPQTLKIGFLALGLVVTYPWMKRITLWPQVFLGLTYGIGIPLAAQAQGVSLDTPCWVLYISVIGWTIGYDTIYAFQDLEDDQLIGIGSTARKAEKNPRLFIGFFYTLMIIGLLMIGLLKKFNFVYYLGVGGVTLHLTWQIMKTDFKNSQDCLEKFKSNVWVGWGFLGTLALSKILG